VSTICRHSSRVVTFLQAVARPEFRGPRSASIAPRNQVWLGLPAGRFQSGGLVVYTLQGLGGGPRENELRTASDMAEEPQTSISHHGEKMVNNQSISSSFGFRI